jgi:hypothetical protein
MNEALKILVIIESSVLSIFLAVCIVLSVILIRILRDVKHITQKAEKVVDSAESVGEVFRQAAGPFFLVRLLRNIVKAVKRTTKED